MAATTTKAAPRQQTQTIAKPAQAVAILAPPRILPPPDAQLQAYDVDSQGWRTLVESIFPAAKTATSVMMALDYCKRRKLDVFKHPVHIVPIWNSQANDGKGAMVETIWPGINELRTTAIRTGQYAGMDVPVFGPPLTENFVGKIKKWNNGQSFYEEVKAEVTFPEWCQITVYRTLGGNRVPFPGPRVYWLETYSRLRNDCEVPNSMWEKRANGQLEKCAEAAALRRAFPEELGSDYSIDEIGAFTTHAPTDVTADGSATTAPPEPRMGDFTEPSKKPGEPDKTPAPTQTGDSGQSANAAEAGGAPTVSSGQPAAGVTDVADENAPIEFAEFDRATPFLDFYSKWLAEPDRTPAQAQQWEEHFREHIAKYSASTIKRVADGMADLLVVYGQVLAKGPAREPGAED